MEALPYIKRYHGKTIVIKYGGNAMVTPALQESVMTDIALLKLVGMHVVIVHGGGPQISTHLEHLSRETTFVEGVRVTDSETMEVVRMVMVGKVNKELVNLLNAHGLNAIGLSGEDGPLLKARPLPGREHLGYVGEVAAVNTDMITSLTAGGYLPVIASIGVGEDGQPYNVNADHAAARIASALGADKLIILSNVDGVMRREDGNMRLVSTLTPEECRALIDAGEATEGMIPKLVSCAEAVEAGVERAHILNGTIEHALLLEIFTDEGIGTMITAHEGSTR